MKHEPAAGANVAPANPTHKTCTKCGETKPLECFHKHLASRDGKHPRCKECRKEDRKEERRRDPERVRLKNRERNAKWAASNLEHVRELNRAKALRHYHKNKDTIREEMRLRANKRYAGMSAKQRKEARLRSAYGLSLAEWEGILLKQGNKCAVCGSKEPGARGWQTDHCHNRGHVRGLLCTKCNTALGLVMDSERILVSMIGYLRRKSCP